MELRPGYKRTEAGVIPEDWQTQGLLEVVKIANGQVDPKSEPYNSMILIAPDHIESGTGRLHTRKTAKEQRAISGKYIFDAGQIIYSKIRPYLQKAVLADFDGLCSADMYPLKPLDGISGGFILPVLLGHRFTKYAESVSVRSGMPKINRLEMADFVLAIPSPPEQHAIAAALGDMDALLAGLDRLIAKKRDLKQAAMQTLLTGQTRLQGFSGEWEVKRLGEVVGIRNEKINTFGAEDAAFCIELEQIRQNSGSIDGFSDARDRLAVKYRFNEHDVLFGRLRPYLRKFWRADRQGVCSTEIWPLRPISEFLTAGFLFQIVQTDGFIEAANSSYGTHMPRCDWGALKQYEFPAPIDRKEQAAIADVLTDMDADLAALEARRDKTRALKQAMMQELLTGNIRLPIPELADA
jgi:type I restriction enzyme S subunit